VAEKRLPTSQTGQSSRSHRDLRQRVCGMGANMSGFDGARRSRRRFVRTSGADRWRRRCRRGVERRRDRVALRENVIMLSIQAVDGMRFHPMSVVRMICNSVAKPVRERANLEMADEIEFRRSSSPAAAAGRPGDFRCVAARTGHKGRPAGRVAIGGVGEDRGRARPRLIMNSASRRARRGKFHEIHADWPSGVPTDVGPAAGGEA